MIIDALDALSTMLGGLTISSPKQVTIANVYRFLIPPGEDAPPNVWQMEWAMAPIDISRMIAVRDLAFTVRAQYLAGDTSIAELSILHEIATSFWEALITALYPIGADAVTFRMAQSLQGACSRVVLRGGDPTVGLIPRGGKVYVGAEAYFDIYFNEFWADFNQ